jgi:hypothetical protein
MFIFAMLSENEHSLSAISHVVYGFASAGKLHGEATSVWDLKLLVYVTFTY